MKIKFAVFLLMLLGIGGSTFAQNNARMLSTPNAQTGTTYTFVAADTTRVVTFSNAGAVAVSLPNGATFGFGAGTMLSVVNLGAGTVTITCSSCTINGAATLVLSQNQGADIYGGSGGSAVNYIALPSPAGTNLALQGGNNVFIGNNVFANINNVIYADQQAGADACAKITAAEAILPASGGIVDARGFQGAQSACSAGFAIGTNTKPVQLLLGTAFILVQNQVTISSGSELKCTGASGGNVIPPCGIEAVGTFPASTVLLQFQVSPIPAAIRVRDIRIDCHQATGCTGVDLGGAQDESDLRNVQILNYMSGCITQSGNAQQVQIDTVTCIGSSTAGAHNAITISNTANHMTLINVAVTSQSGAPISGAALLCTACGLDVNGLHVENYTDGVQLTGAGSGVLVGSAILNGVNGLNNITNLIHVAASYTGSLKVGAARKLGSTNVIKNDIAAFSHLCTDSTLADYTLSSTESSPQQLWTTCSTLSSAVNGLRLNSQPLNSQGGNLASVLFGSCSGTATASQTITLYQLGELSALTCTITGAPGVNTGPITPSAKTVKNLFVVCGTGGVNASSGVFTVFKSGVSTTLTVTVGTGNFANDQTHSFTTVANDRLEIAFTTQAAETLANCTASVELF